MIVLCGSHDRHSLEIKRDGRWVGDIQWHKGKEPRIVLRDAFGFLTLSELDQVLREYKTHRDTVG